MEDEGVFVAGGVGGMEVRYTCCIVYELVVSGDAEIPTTALSNFNNVGTKFVDID